MKESNIFQTGKSYFRTMPGIQYEEIICAAYSSKKDGRIGADAEFYNKMERIYLDAEKSGKLDTLAENQKFINAFHEVKLHLRNAITRALERNRLKIKPTQKKNLEAIDSVLRKTGFRDKQVLDELIDKTQSIFDDLGLKEP